MKARRALGPSRIRFRPPRSAWLAAFAALGLGLGTGLQTQWPPRLGAVDLLSVRGGSRVSPRELAAFLDIEAGTPFSALHPEEVARRAASHPWIARAHVVPLPPDRLLVAVEEREGAAVAWIGEPDRLWHVDREGRPFAPAEEPGRAPQIRGVEAEPGVPNAALSQGLRVLEAIAARGLPAPRELILGGRDPRELPVLRIEARGTTQDVLLGGGDLAAALERLAALWQAGLPETAAAAVIDVRFTGQVVLGGGGSAGADPATEARGGAPPS